MDGRAKMKGNGIPSPRGGRKRSDKNAVVPSRMGPIAAGLLNDIRAAKSRNQWTVHDISGKYFFHPGISIQSYCMC